MLSSLFKHIGLKIKENNPWINTFSVNCIALPTTEGNRIVNFEGEEKSDYSFDDTKGCGFYIKTNPRFNYSNGRRINSCDTEYQQNIDFTFVFFSINNDKNLSPFLLESAFTNSLRTLNFKDYTGAERAVRIQVLNSNPNAVDVFRNEINKDLESGSNLVAVLINARLIYDIISDTCEESCIEDLVISDFSEVGGYSELCDFVPGDNTYVTVNDGGTLVRVDCGGEYTCENGGGGGTATVENSDATYSATVNAGSTLVLPDETFYFQLDGVTVDTETEPALSNQTFNIDWT